MSGALKSRDDSSPEQKADTKKPHKPAGIRYDTSKNTVHPIGSTDHQKQQMQLDALANNERAPLLKGSCKNIAFSL